MEIDDMNDQWDDDSGGLLPGEAEILPDDLTLPEAPEALRNLLLAKTSRTIGMRRWKRRVAVASMAAAAYAMGAATMAWIENPEQNVGTVAETEAVALEAANPWGETPATLFLDPEAFTFRVAEAGREEQQQLLKEGGDFYLEVQGDIETAAIFYRRLLDLAPEPRAASRGQRTTWLLATMIASRLRETSNEQLDA